MSTLDSRNFLNIASAISLASDWMKQCLKAMIKAKNHVPDPIEWQITMDMLDEIVQNGELVACKKELF